MFEHRDGRLGDMRIEVMAEGVDEQDDVAAAARDARRGSRKGFRRELRDRAVRRDAEPFLGELRKKLDAVAQSNGEAQQRAMPAGPFGHAAEQPCADRRAGDLVALREIFGLDERHVDGARTFFLAGLAGDAQIHRRVEAVIGEGARVRTVVERRLEGGDARFRRMVAIAGDAVARAHDAFARLVAVAAVHADSDGLGVIAAGRRNAGIGVADAVGVVSRPIEKGFHAVAFPARQSKVCAALGFRGPASLRFRPRLGAHSRVASMRVSVASMERCGPRL
jgi:hypothetical protein